MFCRSGTTEIITELHLNCPKDNPWVTGALRLLSILRPSSRHLNVLAETSAVWLEMDRLSIYTSLLSS